MKIDCIKEYELFNPKDSILRIYDFNTEGVKKLLMIFGELAEGKVPEIDLGHYSFISSVGGINLILKIGTDDIGVEQTSESDFVCTLTKSGWENAINLAQPFSESVDANRFQWLYDLGTDIDLLLSSSGRW